VDEPILQLDCDQQFPSVQALHDVHMALYPGQVTALLEKCGKPPSSKCSGIYRPDAGQSIGGKLQSFSSRRMPGAPAFPQFTETVMFDDLTVAENIFIGSHALRSGKRIDWQLIGCGFGPDVLLKRLAWRRSIWSKLPGPVPTRGL
jgi:rhamnose transport system ATP-binding protein